MTVKQKGFFVGVARITGLLLFFISIFWIFSLILTLLLFRLNLNTASDWFSLFFGVFFNLLLAICIGFAGYYYAGLFPDLYITDSGIVCKNLIFPMKINWQDIDQVVKTKDIREAKAILLKRKGLLVYRLYGLRWARVWNKPAVIVLTDSENFAILEHQIFELSRI